MFEVLFAVIILAKCAATMRTVYSLEALRETRDRAAPEKTSRLAIIIPVYKETNSIEECVARWTARHFDTSSVSIVIVGTSRERASDGNATLRKAHDAATVSGSPNIHLLEYEGGVPLKAAQVNFALKWVQSELSIRFALVEDVDTVVNPLAISAMMKKLTGGACFVQQHSVFFKNYSSLPALGRSFAAYQSRWTVSHEIPRIYLGSKFGLAPFHVVGHGFGFDIDRYWECGGFDEQEPIEDIDFGFKLALNREPVEQVLVLENSDVPVSTTAIFRQQVGWSYGVWRTAFGANLWLESRPLLSVWFHLVAAMRGLLWLLTGSISFALMFCAIRGDLFALAALCSVLVEYASGFILLRRLGATLPQNTLFLTFLAFANNFVRWVPVLISLLIFTFRVPYKKYKSNR